MRLSVDEHNDAEAYLEEKDLKNDAFDKLRVIARYYIDNDYNIEEVKEQLRVFVANCGENYTLNVWHDMIEAAAKRAKKTPAILIDYVSVTEPEMEVIAKIKGIRARRFAFTLLCLKKYYNAIRENNNGWICVKHSELMRLANIKISLDGQAELYRVLIDAGLIELPDKLNRVAIHVTFDDIEGKEAVRVDDFRSIGNQYMMATGGPYYRCHECGLVVRMPDGKKRTKPYKYCKECAIKVKTRQSIESVMKKYYKDVEDIDVKISGTQVL